MHFFYKIFFITAFLFFNITNSGSDKFIVTADWLSKHINDSNIIIFQVGEKEAYEAGHIPGAYFIGYDEYAPKMDGLYRQMPSPENLKSLFENYGISNNSKIILYTTDWITPMTRLYLTLDFIGLGDNTVILDGGIEKWKSEEHKITKEIPAKKKGNILIKPKDIIATKDYILKNMNEPNTTIIDARTEDYYSATSEHDNYPRPGHITGAFNIQFTDLTSEKSPYLFKSINELKKIFENAFVKKNNTTVAYCHIGQQASLVYFVGKMLGYNMKLYDGSFQEWSADENCPVTGKVKVKRN